MQHAATIAFGLAVAATLIACSATSTPSPDASQMVTATNLSPRVAFLAVGWSESAGGEVSAGKVTWALLPPCGGSATTRVDAVMWQDRNGVRSLPLGIAVDASFNADVWYSQLAPLQSPDLDTLGQVTTLPIWTRGDVTQLPLALVVDPDVTVREVDPSAARATVGACTPQTLPSLQP
jgi:hypothetical protein